MLYTVFAVLGVLWLVGVLVPYTAGGLIHILLVIALIALILQIIGRRRIV